MSEWDKVALGTLAAPKIGAISIGPFGSAMKSDTYVPFGVPVIRGTNISKTRAWKGDWVYISDDFANSMPRCIVTPNSLVFPHRGSVGEVALIPGGENSRYFLSTSLMKIDLDEKKVNPLFAYYFFKSLTGRDEILKYASQVGTPGIGQPLASLKSFTLPCPPLAIQADIALVLSVLDDKIELNRQMNETLEAMARAIFKDWFVDFGPTRAKMAGIKPYLAPEIWDLFPDGLDDEGKPRGWEDRTISKLADLNPESWSRANYPLEIRYVDLANTKWGTIESTELHTTETAPSRAQRIIRPGDTIIGTVRPGNGSYALIDDEGFTASTGFAVLRPKLPSHREIVYLSLTMPENIDRLSHLADGGAYPAVRPEVIAATEVMIAPSSVTLHFSDMVAPLIDRMEANKRENSTLAKMRDILLPKLMSGEIRIPDSGPTAELVLAKAS